MEEPPKKKVVTPQQLGEGWEELIGMVAHHRHFTGVVQMDDGNYEVDNPEWLLWAREQGDERMRQAKMEGQHRRMYPGLYGGDDV